MQGYATDDEQQYRSHGSVMRPRGALPAFGEHGCLAAFQCRVRARKRASRGHQKVLCCRSAISGTNAASSAARPCSRVQARMPQSTPPGPVRFCDKMIVVRDVVRPGTGANRPFRAAKTRAPSKSAQGVRGSHGAGPLVSRVERKRCASRRRETTCVAIIVRR